MFESDRSAARGEMAARKLVVFRHESPLGNAQAHKLFDRVKVERTASPAGDSIPARSYRDYTVTVDDADLPQGISILQPF